MVESPLLLLVPAGPVEPVVGSGVVVLVVSDGVVDGCGVVPVALVVAGSLLVASIVVPPPVTVVVDVAPVVVVVVAGALVAVSLLDVPPPGPQAARRTAQVSERIDVMAGTMAAAARRVKRMGRYDCTLCGACCCNPPGNRTEGFVDYIEVDERAPLLKKPELVRRLVVVREDDVMHMRLDPEGRCLALRGRVGKHVRCTIYADRPRACWSVEPASDLCRAYREARGLRP